MLAHIGQFGRFQWKIFFLLSLVSATSGLAVVVFVFTGRYIFTGPYTCSLPSIWTEKVPLLFVCNYFLCIPALTPKYRCRVPECELANSSYYDQEVCHHDHQNNFWLASVSVNHLENCHYQSVNNTIWMSLKRTQAGNLVGFFAHPLKYILKKWRSKIVNQEEWAFALNLIQHRAQAAYLTGTVLPLPSSKDVSYPR